MKSPTLQVSSQFELELKIIEWGVSLITLNRRTNMIEDYQSVINTNLKYGTGESDVEPSQYKIPQLHLSITKNNPALATKEIEYDINLQIG
jgi:hypothetical protein